MTDISKEPLIQQAFGCAKGLLDSEAEARFVLGAVVWKILFEESRYKSLKFNKKTIHVDQVALSLGIPPYMLRGIMHGDAVVGVRHIVEENNWRGIFSRDYSEKWDKHGQDFDAALASLDKALKKRWKWGEPRKKNSFEHDLWGILGGDAADIEYAAAVLNIPLGRLSEIIRREPPITEKELRGKFLREKLASHYPQTWRRNAVSFEKHCAELFPKPEVDEAYLMEKERRYRERIKQWTSMGKPKYQRPKKLIDKGHFGHVVGEIIFSEKVRLDDAAVLLGIGNSSLTAIINGRREVSYDLVYDEGWPLLLENNFSGWEAHKSEFIKRLNVLPRNPSLRLRRPQRHMESLRSKSIGRVLK